MTVVELRRAAGAVRGLDLHRGIRVRLLALVLLALVPAVVVSVDHALEARAASAQEARVDALRVAGDASRRQAQLIEETGRLLSSLAQVPAVRRAERPGCSRLLARLVRQFSAYANLGVVDSRGVIVCSAAPYTGVVSVADRAYFRRAVARRALAVGDYQIGRLTRRATVNVALPTFEGRRLSFVTFAALDLEWLHGLLSSTSLPAGSVVTTMDSRGTILARSPDRGHAGRHPLEVPVVREILSAKRGTTTAVGLDGVTRHYGFVQLPGGSGSASAYVSVGIPKAAALVATERRFVSELLVLAGVGLLALLMSVIVGHGWLVAPVAALSGAAQRISMGDLGARVATPPGSPKELRELAASFNTMAESLSLRNDELLRLNAELEARVEQRAGDLEHFFTLALEMLCIADLDGHFVRVNPTFERTLGYTAEELVQRPFLDFVHPDDVAATLAAVKDLSEGIDIASFENRYRCKDGSYRWILWSSTAVPERRLIYAAARDITERKTAELEIQRLNDELQSRAGLLASALDDARYQAAIAKALLDATSDAICLVDDEGRTMVTNVAMERMARDVLQLGPGGDLWETLRGLGERTADPEAYRAAIRDSGSDEPHEFQMAGSGRWIQRYTTPVHDSAGQLIGRMVLLRDVTAEREMDRLKTQLVASVSHELRTPLASILGFAELLLDGVVDEAKRTRYAETIYGEAQRLSALVNDFLDLQRIEAGRFSLALEDLPLGDLLAEQVALFSAQSKLHTLSLRAPTEPVVVRADRQRIAQVVANLLSNAVKYSPAGGEVVVEVEQRGDAARVSVSDCGIGIPEDQQAKLFSRFFRVDAAETRAIGGTGLGLALAREIVVAHGGRIGFTSRLGKGSTFWFELPVAAAAAARQSAAQVA